MDKVFAALRTFGVLLGIWVVLFVVGIITGVVPLTGGTGDAPDPDDADAGTAAADGGVERDDDEASDPGAPADASVAATVDDGDDSADDATDDGDAPPAAPTGFEGIRWAVCDAPAEPSLAVADVFGDPLPEIIVGCADGWHVLGMGATGPARVARFAAPPTPADQRSAPGAAAVGDVDGDGERDLVLPLAFLGDNGASRGGGLYWVPRDPYGGIREPSALAPITAVFAIVAPIDGADGDEVVAMNRANALAQLDSEAWVFGGGAAPTRTAALVVGLNGRAARVADVDRDGHADVVALSDGRVDLHFGDGAGAFGRTHTLELEGAREVGLGDLDGDGGADLAVLGAQGLRWIRAGAIEGMEPHGVDGIPANLRGLQVLDADGDAKMDLLGWDHPRLLFLRQRDPVDFEPRTGFTLAGGPFGPRRHAVADLDADGRADDLVLLGTTAGDDAPLEVILVLDALDGAELTPPDRARPVDDAPLVLRATLR